MKMEGFLLTCIITLILVCNCIAQKPFWLKKLERVILLQSTRQDVINLFGEPEKSDYLYFRVYNLKEGKLYVDYSMGYCTELKRKGWNVPEFVVTGIFFSPKKQVKPEQLSFDLTRFEMFEIFDVPGAFNGSNDELGIEFTKTTKGKIESISFYPPSKYDHLYCKE